MTTADDGDRAQASLERGIPFPRRLDGGRGGLGVNSVALVALAAFVIGAGSVGALVWHGDLARILPASAQRAALDQALAGDRTPAQATTLETRLAMLEDRFSRIDQQSNAAAGNASRAEALLIAQATRRAIERGQPLGYLADQLRLRFANVQPRAVETLIAFAQRPVTLSALDAQLDVLAPRLANLPRETSSWSRIQSALAGLFTIRSDSAPVQDPSGRIRSAKLLLANGNVDAATDTVARLPGASDAGAWADDARRYGSAQQALDVIEAAAVGPATGPHA